MSRKPVKPTVWMPLHIDAWRTKTRRLSPLERCAYMDLLMEYWDTQAPLTVDHDDFANLIGISREEWDSISSRVLRFFSVGEDGLLHQSRIDEEIEKANRMVEQKRKAGRKGGVASASKRQASATPHAQARATPAGAEGGAHPRGLGSRLREASPDAQISNNDTDIENCISKQESAWGKDPEVKKIRASVQEKVIRGVA